MLWFIILLQMYNLIKLMFIKTVEEQVSTFLHKKKHDATFFIANIEYADVHSLSQLLSIKIQIDQLVSSLALVG